MGALKAFIYLIFGVCAFIFLVICLVLLTACSPINQNLHDVLTDQQQEVRTQVLVALEETPYYMPELVSVGVQVLPKPKVEEYCKNTNISGCAYLYVIFIVEPGNVVGDNYCQVLVHEYMHIVLYYQLGDSDANHKHSYEFYDLPYEICQSLPQKGKIL
jgi:hypothetical protein